MPSEHRRRDGRRRAAHRRGALAPRPAAAPALRRSPQAPLLLEIPPPLHGDLAAVELAVLVVPALVGAGLGARRLPRVAPGEVVEVPEAVGRQDEVPDGQGDEVDDHPEDVDEAVGGDDDEDAGEAEDEEEED